MLDDSSDFRLKFGDREAKTKKIVPSGCVDLDGITSPHGLNALMLSFVALLYIAKKFTARSLWKARPAEGSKTSMRRM